MFKLEKFMGKRVLKSSLIDDNGVSAFFTTRDLPLKFGERQDLSEEVEKNKKLVCDGLNLSYENLVIPQQTHSDNIGILLNKIPNYSSLTSHLSLYENTDALITNQPQIALALNFADCVPILFYDSVGKAIGAAHAGWRGTVAKIGPKTVEKMIKNFSCKPENITALIGPAIGKCCFEVQDDVKEKLFETIDQSHQSETCEKNNLDLKLINKFQLLDIGIKNIDLCEYCTSCQNELFFSYRKENGTTARHSTVIMLRNKN